jgi:Fe-S-cluster containining protein
MSSEYAALVAKVDGFVRNARSHAGSDITCERGCSGCCGVSLSLAQVEADQVRRALRALPEATRLRAAARGRQELHASAVANASPRCALLEDDGSCAVYEQRPLVCRTQGHALRYPTGFVPAAAVRTRTTTGEITHCPLNFTENPPQPAAVLDAERMDLILAVVNQRFSQAHDLDRNERHAISELAVQATDSEP